MCVDINKIHDTETVETCEEPAKGASESYHIGSLENIEVAVNRILHCSCESYKIINSFIDFCSKDNHLDANIMIELQSERVKRTKQKPLEVNLTNKNFRIVCSISIICSRCRKVETVSLCTSKCVNTNIKGGVDLRKNSSWYDLNLKGCIGTLACGLGVVTYLNSSHSLFPPKVSDYIRGHFLFANIELEELHEK